MILEAFNKNKKKQMIIEGALGLFILPTQSIDPLWL